MSIAGNDGIIALPEGRKLAYAEYGNRHGHPVLYMHSNPGTRRQLPSSLHPLAESHRIIVPDRPGYGRSSPPTAIDGTSLIQDTDALCSELGVSSVRIIGFSTGAAYAAMLAASQAAVSDLVLISPLIPGPIHSHVGQLPVPLQDCLAAASGGPHALLEAWSRAGFTAADMTDRLTGSFGADELALLADPAIEPWLGLDQSESMDGGLVGMAADYALLARTDLDLLNRISCPVHIWNGGQDRIAPPVIAEELAKAFRPVQHHFEPDRGHLLPFLQRAQWL